MSLLVTFNGANYIIPETNEVGWGSNLDAYFVAIAAGCLQKTGGSFTLSAETDFGASFGLKSLYYKSRASNVASTGALRLANAETGIVWRNALNNADLPLTVNSSNQLTFNGTAIGGSGIYTASRAIVSDGSGNLAAATTTSTEIGYVNGVTSAIQTQLNTKATGTITSGVANRLTYYTGATTLDALTAITASKALVSDTNGLPVASATTATELGYVAGVTSAIQTQIDSKATDSLVVHLAGTETITGSKTFSSNLLTASSIGLSLKDDSTHTVLLKATNSTTSYTLSLPTTAGSSNQYLTTDGSGNTSWTNAAGSGTVSSGTAGRLSLYATSTNTVSDTYVQNTKNITLAIATQASRSANLALTIPNPGDAVTAASVVLTEGATTINGALTLASDLTESGRIVINGNSSGQAISINQSVAGVLEILLQNTSATSGAHALTVYSVTSGSGGDPYIRFSTNSTDWAIGADNSASDKFCIAASQNVGNTNWMEINPSTGHMDYFSDASFSGSVAFGTGTLPSSGVNLSQLKVIQFVTATTSTQFTTTSATFQTSNLTASITPSSSSNKVLILAYGNLESSAGDAAQASIFRSTTNLGGTNGMQITSAGSLQVPCALGWVDSPATTSSTTYSVKLRNTGGSETVAFGHSNTAQFILLAEVVA